MIFVRKMTIYVILILSCLIMANDLSYATMVNFSRPLVEEILSESNPTAMSAASFNCSDYEVSWVGEPLADVKFGLAEGSLQWVRVRDVLTLPRGMLTLEIKDLSSGQINYANFVQSITVIENHATVDVPVALISNQQNKISLTIHRGQDVLRGHLRIQFKSKGKFQSPVSHIKIDPSCSKYNSSVEGLGNWKDDWAYIGCRLVRARGTSILETLIFWDQASSRIEVGGLSTASVDASLWALRLSPDVSRISLKANGRELTFHYSIPKTLHNASLGVGIGAYSFKFHGNGNEVNSVLQMTTIYGSYFITEALRGVFFGEIASHSHLYSDFGLYLHTEYGKMLDNRITMSLLIGGRGFGFKSKDQFNFIPSAIQGFEVSYTDAFTRGTDLTAGAFIYPLIAGNAYYSFWLRWGNRRFLEVNYTNIIAESSSINFNSSNMGVSLGFPLLQLF